MGSAVCNAGIPKFDYHAEPVEVKGKFPSFSKGYQIGCSPPHTKNSLDEAQVLTRKVIQILWLLERLKQIFGAPYLGTIETSREGKDLKTPKHSLGVIRNTMFYSHLVNSTYTSHEGGACSFRSSGQTPGFFKEHA